MSEDHSSKTLKTTRLFLLAGLDVILSATGCKESRDMWMNAVLDPIEDEEPPEDKEDMK